MPSPKTDKELMARFQEDPEYFVFKMWGLTRQPILPGRRDEVAKAIRECRLKDIRASDFVPMGREELKAGKHFTWQQFVILAAVRLGIARKAPRWISVASGHGIGKSATMSWLLLWFLMCHLDAQVSCTAPTSNQMHDVLWKEVALWIGRMPKEVSALYEWSADYVRIVERPKTWFARARTASKENSEALAGVHGEHVMLMADEASGVADEIYRSAAGALTGPNVFFLMFSNWTRLTGHFHESQTVDAGSYQALTFDSSQSPIVDPSFVGSIVRKHGADSDEYRIRVAGTGPKAEGVDAQGYVPLLEEADLREAADARVAGRVSYGIDPSGEGSDPAAGVVRDAFKAKVEHLDEISSPKDIARLAVDTVRKYGIDPKDCAYDNFGIGADVGKEVALFDPAKPIDMSGVNVGVEAEDANRFFNRRAELFWRVREWVKAGGSFVDLDKWKDELMALRFRRTEGSRARIQVMDKRTMRKLGLNHGKSPNRVDALALTFNRIDQAQGVPSEPYRQPAYEPISVYEG